MTLRHDTTADAARVQADIWRKMTGQRRVELAAEMSENVRRIAAEGVRQRHPEYSDDQVHLAVIRLSLGDDLFRLAYPDCDLRP
jgi:hypothetical protein